MLIYALENLTHADPSHTIFDAILADVKTARITLYPPILRMKLHKICFILVCIKFNALFSVRKVKARA